MADQELAPDGGEALEIAPEEERQDDTPEPIVNLAKDLGWTPQDQWQGDPGKWKPAEQFIRDGREIQQTTARELRSVREQMERFASVNEAIIEDRVAAANAEWQRRYDEAFDAGDKAAANALLKQQPTVPAANGKGPDPKVVEWVGKNPWYNSDPLAQARAAEISDRLAHLPVPDQLAQVERAIRKEFPEHFPKAKDPPSTQTAATRSTGPTNRVKGFADMPLASQQVALDYEKRLGVPKEQTAKSYWAEQEGVKR